MNLTKPAQAVELRRLSGCSTDEKAREGQSMNTASFLLLGLGIGVVIGWPLQRLNTKPLVQSILAMQLSWMFAALVCGLLWVMAATRNGGVGALSFGLSEIMLTILPVALVAAGIHALLGRVATARPSILKNRAIILGSIGGVCGAMLSGPFGCAREFLW
jgi:hypothetical protein